MRFDNTANTIKICDALDSWVKSHAKSLMHLASALRVQTRACEKEESRLGQALGDRFKGLATTGKVLDDGVQNIAADARVLCQNIESITRSICNFVSWLSFDSNNLHNHQIQILNLSLLTKARQHRQRWQKYPV